MAYWKRAILHTIRKRGKTILLFLFLLTMETLMLTGLSIYSAANAAAFQVRKSLGGSFTINAKQLSSGLSKKNVLDILSCASITEKYNLRSYTQAVFSNPSGDALTIETAETSEVPYGYEHAGKVVADRYSEQDTYFEQAGFELVRGVPITPEQEGGALIHERFAALNHLALGDTFVLSNVNDPNEQFTVTVIGIFTNKIEQDSIGIAPSYDLYENIVFTDIATGSCLLFGKDTKNCQYGDIYVDDPEKLNQTIQEVQNISGIPWKDCIVTKYDKEYQNAKAAILYLQNIVSIAVIVVSVISIALLSLILILWIRNRIHEIGVLSAIGIGKINILLQQILEAVIVAIPTFVLSFFSGTFIAQAVSDRLIQAVSEGMTLHVEITVLDWLLVSAVSLCFVAISVLLSSYPLMRMKPKNILSQMS